MLTLTIMTLIGLTCLICLQQKENGKEAATMAASFYLVALSLSMIYTISVDLPLVTLQILICMVLTSSIMYHVGDHSFTNVRRLISDTFKDLKNEKLSNL
jgi:hypothetical protein